MHNTLAIYTKCYSNVFSIILFLPELQLYNVHSEHTTVNIRLKGYLYYNH